MEHHISLSQTFIELGSHNVACVNIIYLSTIFYCMAVRPGLKILFVASPATHANKNWVNRQETYFILKNYFYQFISV